MKEIGESFKLARETIGLSKTEVVKDLNITISQLDNLEDGNANAFKDVFFLKDLVKKYTKYLNLDEEKIMGTFNDFIFSYTSRIPVEDILEQTREINILEKKNVENKNKVISPYTKIRKEKTINNFVVAICVVLSLIVVIFLLIVFMER